MGRKRKVVRDGKLPNALADALEAGTPIEGMKGFIRLTDSHEDDEQPVYVQVKALGLSTQNCGLKVRVGVVSGSGELEIPPCRWRNSVADLNFERDLLNRAQKAYEDWNEIVCRPHYLSGKKRLLAEYLVEHLDDKQIGEFYDDMKSTLKKTTMDQVSLDEIGKLAKTAVLVANDLTNDDVEDYSFSRY